VAAVHEDCAAAPAQDFLLPNQCFPLKVKIFILLFEIGSYNNHT